MNITIIGATGKAGKMILTEALERKHQVSALVRNAKNLSSLSDIKVIEKDALNLTYSDIKHADVIINAFGAWTEDTLPLHKKLAENLVQILSGKPNRLIIIGGAGSLYTDDTHTLKIMDTPDFPDAYKPIAYNMGLAFDIYKSHNDINWAYLSPAANFDPNLPRTGNYILGDNVLLVNSKGESVISYADYAIAIIDEAEQQKHNKQRFTLVGEY